MRYSTMMNMVARAMQQSGQPAQPKQRRGAETYVAVNGQQAGPFTKTELEQLVRNGTLTPSTYVWTPAYTQWVAAESVPHINALFLLAQRKPKAQPAAPAPVAQTPVVAAPSVSAAEQQSRDDATAAVIQLGYPKNDARKLIDAIFAASPGISTQDAIKQALQRMF